MAASNGPSQSVVMKSWGETYCPVAHTDAKVAAHMIRNPTAVKTHVQGFFQKLRIEDDILFSPEELGLPGLGLGLVLPRSTKWFSLLVPLTMVEPASACI